MTNDEFEALLTARLTKTRNLLSKKGDEYAPGADRLSNFHRAGEVLNCSPERALLGYATKHLVSVMDIIDGLDRADVPPDLGAVDEKIGDLVAYMILLESLLTERAATREWWDRITAV